MQIRRVGIARALSARAKSLAAAVRIVAPQPAILATLQRDRRGASLSCATRQLYLYSGGVRHAQFPSHFVVRLSSRVLVRFGTYASGARLRGRRSREYPLRLQAAQREYPHADG